MCLFLSGCTNGNSAPRSATSASEGHVSLAAAADAKQMPEWDISLDNIEACSCPTFCQCYFNDRPALQEAGKEGHEHFTRIEMRSTDMAGPHASAASKRVVSCATGQCCSSQ